MSKIVDIFDAERQKYKNHRFGRDYYTKQASTPSGKIKPNEEHSGYWRTDHTKDENELYKAVPAITDNSDNKDEFSETMNSIVREQHASDFTNHSDLSFLNLYNDGSSKEIEHTYTRVNTEDLLYYSQSDVDMVEQLFEGEKKMILNNKEIRMNDNESTKSINADVKINETILEKKPISETQNKVYTEAHSKHQINRTNGNKNKKLDNTLIKKIYSNPVVRNFALINREQIPGENDNKVKLIEEKSLSTTMSEIRPANNSWRSINNKSVSQEESEIISTPITNTFSLEFSDNENIQEEQPSYRNLEFDELREMRVVANRLGEFSKSFPNLLMENSNNFNSERQTNTDTINLTSFEKTLSVKDLKKIFENKNVPHYRKDIPVHSITGRSISIKLKEELRKPSNNSQ